MAKPPASLLPPALDCFRVDRHAPDLVPATSKRDWMEATHSRFAYRCTPMVIANASGWELRTPFAFEAAWDGTPAIEAITVVTNAGREQVEKLVASHFGYGVLTFHVGWLFRTPPGWAVWARGIPNHIKDGIQPLDGLVETDWLPFTFTMNWRFTRPGSICFEKDEPFCFLTLAPHGALDSVQPQLREVSDDPAFAAEYSRWQDSRSDFNARLRSQEEGALKEGWQRSYIRGAGEEASSSYHVSKRKLKAPRTPS